MRTPRQVSNDILDFLGVDDASRKERAFLAKVIYRTQRDAFMQALYTKEGNTPLEKWWITTRKFSLNGSQI